MSAQREKRIDDSGAAIVCEHIAEAGCPILRACRDESLVDEDSGWQFTCGADGHTDETGRVWSLSEVISHDASLMDLIQLPVGTAVTRSARGGQWENIA